MATVLQIRCQQHGRHDIPAADVVLTWTASIDCLANGWTATIDCPGGHRVAVFGISTLRARTLIIGGARHVETAVPFEPATFPAAPPPRQLRPADVRDPLIAAEVERLIDELNGAADLAGHAVSEQKVRDAHRRRRTDGAK